MKPFFAKILVICCISITTLLAQADIIDGAPASDVQRAADQKIELLLQEIKELKNTPAKAQRGDFVETLLNNSPQHRQDRGHCDDDDDNNQPTCVRNCTARNSQGNCYIYGNDYCAPNAVCVENCTARNSQGVCYIYGSDHCAPNATCSENCTARNSQGVCYIYGADVCY